MYAYDDMNLSEAVRRGLALQKDAGEEFVWLYVTNRGSSHINYAALRLLDLPGDWGERGGPTDPNVG